jgi:cyclic pyranopterin phosphate synthase
MIFMSELTHFNEQGHAKMVDISDKRESLRIAIARSSITVNKSIHSQITENTNKKGDVFAVAQVAGIMAAKNTSHMIPMCHPIMLTGTNITFDWAIDESINKYQILIKSEVKTTGSTGVEMEALVAASATALTIYDMCKAAGKDLVIGETMLISKTGGKNGDYHRDTT